MFDWESKVQFLRDNPRYNNAELFGVRIEAKENSNWAASVYRLKDDDDWPDYSIYIEALCKQNERQSFRAVNWGWQGMTAEQKNQIGAIFADKPSNEIKSHPIPDGQHIWLEIAGGDRVVNLNTVDFPNSYLVLFQEVDKSAPPPPGPDPEPAPDPAPPALVGSVQVTVNQDFIVSLQPDIRGNVSFLIYVRTDDDGAAALRQSGDPVAAAANITAGQKLALKILWERSG